MHANWGKASCSGGAGNTTLSALDGYPTPYQCAGTRPFPYVALTSLDRPLEAGWGHMSDATTFVRDRVVATYDGTTVTQGVLSPSTLPNGARILCSPHAATVEAMMPTVDATTAGSRMLTSAHRTSPTANATPTSLQVIYQAFLLRSGVVANSLGINVVTAAASGGQAQMALHYLGANGAIGDQIPGAVTSAFAVTTTGMKSNSLGTPQFLLPGMYIAAFLFSGSGLVVTGYATTGNSLIGGSPFGFIGNSANPVEYRTETVSSFALPSTPGATATSGIGTAPAPMTFLGVL